ncbi:ExbD/TolR family protein [Fluviicola taffensis]|uniref:Biopolymer transport protein ExbD/TolR n=1 Tax=Fluviicola taffensis (strain DSM 16823 / NCIMB 13979 / RW262) TaxID=755732 RepID=F2IAG9_FLUTR|nr:biopolymer transporter ExbD [Fluviicola taffensis]AEA43105.1 Biopolymer transport protein ExbD/TolR [Fluviicola taffensis DSM 16823]
MAELAQDDGGGKKGGKKRPNKGSARIDMTPMVDLGFLLLTFFVLTSTFAKPKVMSLVYPAKDPIIDENNPPAEVNNAITFIISDDKLFYYKGEFYPEGNTKGKPATELIKSNFGPDGIRKLLADENKFVLRKKAELDNKLQRKEINDSIYKKEIINAKKDKLALKVLIKTDMKAKTRNFIDVIDELYIASIGVIAPVDIMNSEQALLDKTLEK